METDNPWKCTGVTVMMKEFLISLSKSEPNEMPSELFHQEYFMPYLISGMVIGLSICSVIIYFATN